MNRKMRTIVIYIIVILVVGTLIGCSGIGSGGDEEIKIVCEVYLKENGNNDIRINYPQFQGLEDKEKEEHLNELIEEEIMKVLEIHDEAIYERDNLFLHLDYEIKFLNENIISIFYEGSYGAILGGGKLPSTCAATTIDIQKERVITRRDIIADFDTLSVLLLEDKFEDISVWDGMTGVLKMSDNRVDKDELIKLLKEEEYDMGGDYVQWYTNGNNLVIVYYEYFYEQYAIDMVTIENILSEDFLDSLKGKNQIAGKIKDYYMDIGASRREEISFVEEIEKEYPILEYDICGEEKEDYEDTILKDYLKEDIEEAQEVSSKFMIDYHLFDFNDDGLNDYLVCFDGIIWSKREGDLVRIYIQEKDGGLRSIFNNNMQIHKVSVDGHAQFIILDKKTNGYYDIVAPQSNQILRYSKRKGEYTF